MKLKDIKIGTKLIASYILLALITGVVGLLGINGLTRIGNADTALYRDMTVPLSETGDMAVLYQRIRINGRDFIYAKNDDNRRMFNKNMHDFSEQFLKIAESYKSTIFTDEGMAVYNELVKSFNQYTSFFAPAEALVAANDIDGAIALMKGDWRKAGDPVQQYLDKMKELKVNLAQKTANDNIALAGSIRSFTLALVIIAILFAIILGIIIAQSITKPLIKGVNFANNLANGDLTAKLDVNQKDEVGQLAMALTAMTDKLREVIENIMSGAENIADASMQMSATSQQISQGASEQASSTEEVSSSMEEMTSNIMQNTDNALQTEKISNTALDGVNTVGAKAGKSLVSIKEIAQKITIINDIAFQTNILALNAAVEAARAGEHGKGFAVVAAEVRKLAERSKIAADEIGIQSKSSVDVTEEAGELMGKLAPEIEKTARLVQEIAAASQEQNRGADQINIAIQQLNMVTQQNAAASEELASASEELAGQAEQLKETVSYFNLGYTGNAKQKKASQMQKTQQKHNVKQVATSSKANAGTKLNMFTEKHSDNDFEKFS